MAALVSNTQFREDFTEFSRTDKFPEPLLTFWLAVAEKLVNADRWGDLTALGVELFAAHNITLEANAQLQATFGKVPGMAVGVLTSKSVDKVSAGYDASGSMVDGAGHWNLTIYGQRYIKLVQLHGAGPVQVGVPGYGGVNVAASAWPGVIY